jgi:integrase
MAKRKRQNGTGSVRQLPSGRWQARFPGPDGLMRPAATTFDTKLDATAWLTRQTQDVDRGMWAEPHKPQQGGDTLAQYAEQWLASRDLKPTTRQHYRRILAFHINPALGEERMDRITPATVRAWYASLDPGKPTMRAHTYGLLRTIFSTAVADDIIAANPCRIPGAGASRTQHQPKTATLAELEQLVAAMPARLQAMVLLAAWCGLRFGELTELRRQDIDLQAGCLTVRRGVVQVGGQAIVGDPKSYAGRSTVQIPPHLLPMLTEHLDRHVTAGKDALLFAADHGGHLASSRLYSSFYPARAKAGRPDLRFHDLRHTGATLAAATGATLAELMARMGHSTPAAAMRYQHAAADRDRAIAAALSAMAQRASTAGERVPPPDPKGEQPCLGLRR